MAATCEYCKEHISGILYEEDLVIAAVNDTALITGEVTVFPKKHYPIMEMVPDNVLERCAVVANRVGVSIFDGFHAQGTNLLVQNGISAGQTVPHFSIRLIPRQENDGLNLQWQSKKLMEHEIGSLAQQIKESFDKAAKDKAAKNQAEEKKDTEEKKEEPDKKEKKDQTEEKDKKQEKENYMVKVLKRMP